MKLTIRINLDNAAFHEDESGELNANEVMRVLSVVGRKIYEGFTDAHVQDSNGNTVGNYQIS